MKISKWVKNSAKILCVLLSIHLYLTFVSNQKINIANIYCYNMSDDDIVQNFLNDSFLHKVRHDEFGGRAPEFYLIDDNATTEMILRKIKYVVENDVNATQEIVKREYTDATIEIVLSKHIDILQAFEKHNTLQKVTDNVSAFSHRKQDWIINFPLNTAIMVNNDTSNGAIIAIYGSDAFGFNRANSTVEVKQYKTYGTKYSNYIKYEIVNGRKKEVLSREYVDELKKDVNSNLQYHLDYLANKKTSLQQGLVAGIGFRHNFVKVNSCGIAKARDRELVIY